MYLTFMSICIGFSEPVGERKKPIALDKVPAEILKVAQDKFPDTKFETAFTEIEQGKLVYELRAESWSRNKVHYWRDHGEYSVARQ